MKLRKLELKDALLMLEWMHDESVVKYLNTNFSSKILKDAECFIQSSWNNKNNLHFAITSNEDVYMGTVSLKHIKDVSAEFAITVLKSAMQHGYSWFGMEEILKKAFNEFNIESVYWCVSHSNMGAVRFYDKHNFKEVIDYDIPSTLLKRYEEVKNLKWYSILKGDKSERSFRECSGDF